VLVHTSYWFCAPYSDIAGERDDDEEEEDLEEQELQKNKDVPALGGRLPAWQNFRRSPRAHRASTRP